ncbi:MAG: 50S ribosomal protein L4 [Candidatus Taylorbacteria bacterium RIFCSPHIGHO2_02_FULL_45_28]|uniref:Large ribosomal subunit protein uL4 n=1 Tax=Candidatus Taylorbacteria bacterium RIFCSPHIGHO2_12_FULL_45_16 TaxID=1802315 RepID=A0A1G2N1A7_9BACT|nr:MAG: 50S ribosomal protein L4 [Candidatus Taylorbacteria bacterium RIFCSPHIGHO2_01_FULL_44_110]OHA25434.1 MAG: 50S ribosomal protein L4 [Candidatus Taylorbacteria bacterium RIFCSPHIGHO2_02_FULL_45_28]OHA29102.1 MAG: 50S ribosomal protein L4 [Candidatus Taylorbacteria bacterium RIFCSPHIGHO2_12_FULL_45_16]OHA33324.1 MAG: 50S ribosomal protein L4 [Candidatus Taylorbacteria bacterium RIFCSPLOWO2_01_FULL_45_59]OHA38924.1 MAG: 50S ribosomal protein L4 [Candidatus Taylorbacteria bacterium RIFCSPLOW
MEAPIYSQDGKTSGKITLSESIFGVPWNADLVHEIVRLMNSNSRNAIAHTKTRGEVRGGGKKPWQQKGTGRARHGSSRSPIWVGGGVAHGPRNDKNFTRKINKKAKVRALYAILSKKFKDGEILFVDSMNITTAKSKDAKKIISSLATIKGYEKLATKPTNAAMITFDKKTEALSKSFRNFGNVSVEEFRNINPVSILNHSYLIVTNPEVSLKMLSAKIKSE